MTMSLPAEPQQPGTGCATPEFLFPGRRLTAADPCWQRQLERPALDYLQDHRIGGQVLLPGAIYVEAGLALAGVVQTGQRPTRALALTGLKFRQTLVVGANVTPELRLSYRSKQREYSISSRGPAHSEVLHAVGKLAPAPVATPQVTLAVQRRQCPQRLDRAAFYRQLHRRGMSYGPCFRGIRQLWRGSAQALAWIETRPGVHDASHRYYLHPALLDAGFQVLAAALEADDNAMFLPISIREVRYYASPERSLWAYVCLTKQSQRGLEGDILLYNPSGMPLVEVLGFRCLTARQSVN